MKRKSSFVLQIEKNHNSLIQKEVLSQTTESAAVTTARHDNNTLNHSTLSENQLKRLQTMFEKKIQDMLDFLKAETAKRKENDDLIIKQNQLMITMYNEFSLVKEQLKQKHSAYRNCKSNYRKRN
ncbi:hypothetical protein KHA94_21390 [Bacillus sp. FJAT-49705]|uniref:Uncharacterized protein n=1 Tax=Cytobacillus citreus TaxID=2833586 RepID=A0ABS5NXX6_9BACI|nr:hypothetical protein [Cytobacillus citreus]MBS4192699.1 hypothetical protein [Cytobacillus citreus]